jgi:hypothetical protein
MPKNYRAPTEEETRKLDASREMMQRGISGEDDILSKISTTMRKSARDDIKQAGRMREAVPMRAREGEAYNYAGYAKGGKVGSASKRADGCAQRGKTRGKMV